MWWKGNEVGIDEVDWDGRGEEGWDGMESDEMAWHCMGLGIRWDGNRMGMGRNGNGMEGGGMRGDDRGGEEVGGEERVGGGEVEWSLVRGITSTQNPRCKSCRRKSHHR